VRAVNPQKRRGKLLDTASDISPWPSAAIAAREDAAAVSRWTARTGLSVYNAPWEIVMWRGAYRPGRWRIAIPAAIACG